MVCYLLEILLAQFFNIMLKIFVPIILRDITLQIYVCVMFFFCFDLRVILFL